MTEMPSRCCPKRTSPLAAINPVHRVCQQCLPGTDGWQYPVYILSIREAALTAAEVQHADAVLLQHIAQTLFSSGTGKYTAGPSQDIS